MYANQSTPAVITAIDGANIDTLPPVLPNVTDPSLQHLRIIMPFHLSTVCTYIGVCIYKSSISAVSAAVEVVLDTLPPFLSS